MNILNSLLKIVLSVTETRKAISEISIEINENPAIRFSELFSAPNNKTLPFMAQCRKCQKLRFLSMLGNPFMDL